MLIRSTFVYNILLYPQHNNITTLPLAGSCWRGPSTTPWTWWTCWCAGAATACRARPSSAPSPTRRTRTISKKYFCGGLNYFLLVGNIVQIISPTNCAWSCSLNMAACVTSLLQCSAFLPFVFQYGLKDTELLFAFRYQENMKILLLLFQFSTTTTSIQYCEVKCHGRYQFSGRIC